MYSGVNEAIEFTCSLICACPYSSNLPKRFGFGFFAGKIGLGSVHAFSAASKLTIGWLLVLRSAVTRVVASLQVIL